LTVENSTPLQAAEAEVQAHSAGLRKELGLFDLVMAQVLLVIVLDFFGTAAKAGFGCPWGTYPGGPTNGLCALCQATQSGSHRICPPAAVRTQLAHSALPQFWQ